jgi:hypothetical protein
MTGLSFSVEKPVQAASPNRMDIACFVGLVELRDSVARDEIDDWLYQQGWLNSAAGFKATHHRDSALVLRDVPIPVDNWESFDRLFAWETRAYGQGLNGAAYLATAVRSFFAQGGRNCYVVRIARPLAADASDIDRQALLAQLLPGYPSLLNSHPAQRSSWRGVGHILGLPDVSLLCLPDLPDLLRSTPAEVDLQASPAPAAAEQFVICSDPVAAPPTDNLLDQLPAPTSHLAGYQNWANAIHQIAVLLARHRRDVQLVAALPLPDADSSASKDLLGFLHEQGWLAGNLDSNNSIASSFVQLAYPWLKTSASDWLPAGIEPPDGALAGLLARNAITRGAYRSITGIEQKDVQNLHPQLSQRQIQAKYAKAASNASPTAALRERLSLFGFTPDGISLLSDVTSTNTLAHRSAQISRIISMILRAARQAGEEYVFDNNGEQLWAQLVQRMNDVLRLLYNLGALRGKEPEDAWFVRCDRSTMSQQDIDSGRVIAQIQFEPAASIESIEVILAMHQGSSPNLASIGITQAVA